MDALPIVAVDLTAIPANAVGVGRYVQGFLGSMTDADTATFSLRGLARVEDQRKFVSDTVQVGPSGSRLKRLVWEQTGLPRYLRRSGVAVHHGVHYTLPLMTARGRDIKTVATIHDCTFFDHPEWHQRSKAIMFRHAIRSAAKRADALICVSQFTADRLLAHTSPKQDIHVIPHGVDTMRFCPTESLTQSQLVDDQAALERLGLDAGQYVLYVGTLEPRKGVAQLIGAFDRVAARHPDVKLVLAGKRGWGLDVIDCALDVAKHRDRIVELGFVADDDVAVLYRGARVVTYPSEEEGFGLPALEAIACGAPLITTSGSAIEEAVGDAAILVKPDDQSQLADAIDALLHESPDALANAQRRERGIQRAQLATWHASSLAHAAVYRSLL
jgi:glycosyltransferase involved in cell wall biosynthesis